MFENVNNYEIKYILLACCTYNRPSLLEKSLLSIKKLCIPKEIKVEVLVVDNDVEASADSVVQSFSNQSGFKTHYVIEKNRGLAFARNKILDVAKELGVTHIMIFDDDEIFLEDSLISHINLSSSFSEEIVSSGCCINTFDEKTPKFIKNNLIYKKKTTKVNKSLKSSCATDNLFLPMSIIKKHNLKFSNEFIFMGGEDIDFTNKIHNLGYKIVQNNDSILYEPVIKNRKKIKYILKRAYFSGFCGPYIKFVKEKNKTKKIFYSLKESLLLVLLFIFAIPSILCGLTSFLNIITKISKTCGKIIGSLSSKPLEFYKNIQN